MVLLAEGQSRGTAAPDDVATLGAVVVGVDPAESTDEGADEGADEGTDEDAVDGVLVVALERKSHVS